ncbi:DUF4229 domain-containing protein [Spiractinospora alimapuensis]|uniref:DUF4229 domain-containing protein n=1 Tax=Spiractinospora alimapuensis TaxID=2820884 RepID=UPI001F3388BC|nr:DUF4229 domain-containing protein [Spiractinospora alimapuensis]QVQ50982.1 DUF4229 domain-containing protein [Spiractinospora alimapuensis]
MRSVITYTGARLLLFVAAFGLVYMLGGRGVVGLVIALVISGLASYVLLAGQRDAMSRSIVERISRLRGVGQRLDEAAAKEDPVADTNSRGPETTSESAAEVPESQTPETGSSPSAAHDTPKP